MAKTREEPPARKRQLPGVPERLPNPFELKAAEKRDRAGQGKRRKGEKKLKGGKKAKLGKERGQEDGFALREKAEEEDAVDVKGRKEGKKRKREEKAGKGKGNEDEKDEVSESGSLFVSASFLLSTAPVDQQLQFFCKQFESANKFKISSLELEPVKGTCFAQLSEGVNQNVDAFCKHVMDSFGSSWKRILCDGKLIVREIDPGCPALLVISASASRSLELLRGLRSLTNECRSAKLFAKHIKVEDQVQNSYFTIFFKILKKPGTLAQVAHLKNRVNIAGGTPSRIKKLMDMESLGLSRLSLVILDLERDAKGFNLLSLPQVRDEFWELYRSHLHGWLVGGDVRLCFYGSISEKEFRKIMARGGS